ncbi:type II toxin-antitoxin system HipA family toxin [Idiomarina sp. PL1-037]|uniref:type II toxin-antitoxin system HipA family toxin n=1 Tax=Idiomarina sp. PL1-037 TaxID=3095365 RepID=UPI002ACBE74A|nr:type II toxin-antitoxin system HipA family toxin [Idiomarina sp. PL1-037]WQC53587.1 type II toxin-antitoxin system HipA family toxin [Idiomarina sp. PL1-037]
MSESLSQYPSRVRELGIKLNSQSVGRLVHGSQYSFSYEREAQPVSLSMPNRVDPYVSGKLPPIFTMNLPEGFVRRYIEERLRRYAKVDEMYLLTLQRDKGIGALNYHSNELPESKTEAVALNDILSWNSQNEALFPQLLERFYLQTAISGVQPKVVVPSEKATLVYPDLIIKAADEEFPNLTANEFICLSAADYCGLEKPEFWLSDNREHFVMKRFDIDGDKKYAVEDFCVLTKRDSADKYRSSYEQVMKVVQLFTRSAEQLQKVYEYIVFNVLIGNGDAHLKNFSVLYSAEVPERITVTPIYDVTHTIIYPTIDNNMALKLFGSKEFPTQHFLRKLGEDFGIAEPQSVITNFADKLATFIQGFNQWDVFPELKPSMEKHLSSIMVSEPIVSGHRHHKKRKYT